MADGSVSLNFPHGSYWSMLKQVRHSILLALTFQKTFACHIKVSIIVYIINVISVIKCLKEHLQWLQTEYFCHLPSITLVFNLWLGIALMIWPHLNTSQPKCNDVSLLNFLQCLYIFISGLNSAENGRRRVYFQWISLGVYCMFVTRTFP